MHKWLKFFLFNAFKHSQHDDNEHTALQWMPLVQKPVQSLMTPVRRMQGVWQTNGKAHAISKNKFQSFPQQQNKCESGLYYEPRINWQGRNVGKVSCYQHGNLSLGSPQAAAVVKNGPFCLLSWLATDARWTTNIFRLLHAYGRNGRGQIWRPNRCL